MTTERFVFDFDELDAQGLPRCPVAYLFPEPPTPAMLEVVGPYLRLRDRGRRILVEHAIRNLELAGDRMTAHLMYDGGPEPRLLGAIVTGQSKPPEKRYEYDELNAWLLPGEATIDLGGGAPPLKARGIRVVPIREVILSAGAEFVVVVCGDLMRMPGLPRVPSAEQMFVNEQGFIENLS